VPARKPAKPGKPQPADFIAAEQFDPPSESIFAQDAGHAPVVPAGPAIPVEALRRVLKVVTPHFGAGASTVLKQVADRARTIEELHELLVAQAGETVDRKKMKKQLKALAKLPL
jgi:hypothetical protein